MSYPINYPTPQGANVQIFNRNGSGAAALQNQTWVKPQGASFVWFTLIGGGGGGDGTTGGGSAAVTNFMCPAFLIPDILMVDVGWGGGGAVSSTSSRIVYKQKDGTGYDLLTANAASLSSPGGAMSANSFTAMGFFQSIAGQSGGVGTISASSTTFLSAGSDATATVNANYGYSNPLPASGSSNGFFQMQPIIVGVGSNCVSSGVTRNSGVGCGGGASNTNGVGGNGLVVIITW